MLVFIFGVMVLLKSRKSPVDVGVSKASLLSLCRKVRVGMREEYLDCEIGLGTNMFLGELFEPNTSVYSS